MAKRSYRIWHGTQLCLVSWEKVFLIYFLIGGKLVYNFVLVSTEQQCKSIIFLFTHTHTHTHTHIYIYIYIYISNRCWARAGFSSLHAKLGMQRQVQVQALRVSVLEGDAEGEPQGTSKGRVLTGRMRGTKWIRRKERNLLRRKTEIYIHMYPFLLELPSPPRIAPLCHHRAAGWAPWNTVLKAAPSSDSMTSLHTSVLASSPRLWASSDLNPQTDIICGVKVTTETQASPCFPSL